MDFSSHNGPSPVSYSEKGIASMVESSLRTGQGLHPALPQKARLRKIPTVQSDRPYNCHNLEFPCGFPVSCYRIRGCDAKSVTGM